VPEVILAAKLIQVLRTILSTTTLIASNKGKHRLCKDRSRLQIKVDINVRLKQEMKKFVV